LIGATTRSGSSARGRLKARTKGLAAVTAASALVLTACGSDDKGSDSSGADFYKGKTIQMVVPLAPGGGTDIAMRVIAKYLSKHIKGEPKIVVLNEDNGGDSIIGVNQYIHDGSDDGKSIVALGNSNHVAVLFGNSEVEYDLTKDLTPLVGTIGGGVMIARSDTGLTSGADLADYDKQLFFGGRRPDGSFIQRALGLKLLGVEVKELLGYEGASDLDVAFQQGETNVNGVSTTTFLQDDADLVESGDVVPLYTEGGFDADGNVIADPALPDYPTIADVYKEINGTDPSGEEWEAYKTLNVSAAIDKALYVGSDAPKDAVAALQAGITAMLADPDFQTEAKDLLGDYPVLTGEETKERVDKYILNPDPDGLAYVQKLAKDTYGIDLADG
jgi:tripartite-type tricarboxylate transporter receptor subunit TctC